MFNPYYDTKVNNKTPGASFYELGLFEKPARIFSEAPVPLYTA